MPTLKSLCRMNCPFAPHAQSPPFSNSQFIEGVNTMGARQKLNELAVHGCLIAGGIVGLAAQSWLLFFITSAIFMVLSLRRGDIRPNPMSREGGSKSNGHRTGSRGHSRR